MDPFQIQGLLDRNLQFFLFGLFLYVPVNSYGHVGTVSLPSHTFFPGILKVSSESKQTVEGILYLLNVHFSLETIESNEPWNLLSHMSKSLLKTTMLTQARQCGYAGSFEHSLLSLFSVYILYYEIIDIKCLFYLFCRM